MTNKKVPQALFRGLTGLVLSACVAAGCQSQPTPSAQASQSAAMLRSLETMVNATPEPSESVYKAPTAAPTIKVTPKPTPRPTIRPAPRPVVRVNHSLSGRATWYRWHIGQAAAGPLLRKALGPHWRGKVVSVCAGRCVRVKLTDWCLCSRERRLVDLDSRSFARLAPLSRGKIAVTVKW